MTQTLHQELLLETNTDVAEFCPAAGPHSQLLAVGTYQLDEATQQRHGRLHLYRLAPDARNASPTLTLEATLDCPGIFDLQWTQLPSLHNNTPCIGLALADGTMQLLAVTAAPAAAVEASAATATGCDAADPPSSSSTSLQQLGSCQAVSDGMALYLDWQQQHQQQPQPSAARAAVSSSSGGIAVIQVEPTGLTQLLEWQGHDLEAWVVSWDKHQANVLYSGADDSTFKGWDVRCPSAVSSTTAGGCDQTQQEAEPSLQQPSALFSNRKAHGAGVCCISSHPRREHVLATGSYDEAARLWDVRMLQRPVETCQVSTGGGVWRLKWHPRNDSLLLAACMYNGFALLSVNDSWDALQVIEEYKGHDSIAYGADWFKGQWPPTPPCSSQQQTQTDAAGAGGVAQQLDGLRLEPQQQQQQQQPDLAFTDIAATCSFYDRRLHLWSPTTKSC